jgi:carbon-monoxide dehydrogenase medium subunit
MSKSLKISPKVNLNKVNTHIIPVQFEYFEPETLEDAIELLSKYGREAKVLAGGTDLLVKMKQRVIEPKYIINIKRIRELAFIERREDYVAIGAATKLRTLEKSELIRTKFPALYEAIKSMAGIQVRNMATIGGNLCNASPAADTAPPLLVLDAKLKLLSKEGVRVISIGDFFIGPGRTILKPNELLTEILIPYSDEGVASAFIKIARTAMDLAKVNVAASLKTENEVITDVKIALGSVAPTPIRAFEAEKSLIGKEYNEENVRIAAEIASKEIKPITDIRSTAEYRREVTKVIVRDVLMKAYERLPTR